MKWFTSQNRRSSSASRSHVDHGPNPEPLLIKIGPLSTNNDNNEMPKNSEHSNLVKNFDEVEAKFGEKETKIHQRPRKGRMQGKINDTFLKIHLVRFLLIVM